LSLRQTRRGSERGRFRPIAAVEILLTAAVQQAERPDFNMNVRKYMNFHVK